MKTSILALAIGVALAYPAVAYADGIPNIFEGLFQTIGPQPTSPR